MTPHTAPLIDSRCDRHAIVVLLILLFVAAGCDKNSALPTAPSDNGPAGLSIDGMVRQRTDGHGVAGARVEIAEGVNQGIRASADEQGHYRLSNLSPGMFVLRAVADGYAAGSQSVTLSASQTLDFTLDQSSTATPAPATERFTVSGSVTDSRNEAAIRGARVRVVTGPDRGASAETDDAGRYTLSVQPASFRLEASAPSFATDARDVTVSATQVIDFELRAESSPGPSPSGTVVRGTTVNGVSSQPVAGARVRIDAGGATQEATSSSDGAFEVTLSSPDRVLQVTVSSASSVERVTRMRVASDPATLTLIPKSINLAAFNQMFRGDGHLRRWTVAPALVIQRRVLQFSDLDASSFVATATVLSDPDIDSLLQDVQMALAELTGGTFDRFASHSIETASEGQSVSVARTGVIVVAQYQGLSESTTYWGYTRWAWNEGGETRAAIMMLDRTFESTGSPYRHALRTHELGHALGYQHVDARESVMNSSGRVAITEFDRSGARLAFQRPPLNMAPDIDPDPITVNRAPAAGLTWKGAR